MQIYSLALIAIHREWLEQMWQHLKDVFAILPFIDLKQNLINWIIFNQNSLHIPLFIDYDT